MDNTRRLLIRRRTGVRPLGAHVVPGRDRNEKPVSSMNTMAAPFRLAFFADPWPILFEPGPDHLLIAFFGSDGGNLGSPARRPEPGGQVIGVVADAVLAADHISDPFQGPAFGLEACLRSPLAEDPQNTAPLLGAQPRWSSGLGSTPKDPQPRSRVIAQLPGPMLNGPEADTQSFGDFSVSKASGSEQSSSFQPTFFDLALSQFVRAPHG